MNEERLQVDPSATAAEQMRAATLCSRRALASVENARMAVDASAAPRLAAALDRLRLAHAELIEASLEVAGAIEARELLEALPRVN